MDCQSNSGLDHSVAQVAWNRILIALGDKASAVINRLTIDSRYVERVAELLALGGYLPPKAYSTARDTMAAQFYGLEEVLQVYNVELSGKVMGLLRYMPWSSDVLIRYQNSHGLFLVMGYSVEELIKQCDDGQRIVLCDRNSIAPSILTESGSAEWKFLRLSPVLNFFNRRWSYQHSHTRTEYPEEECASLRDVLFASLLYYRRHGVMPFQGLTLRVREQCIVNDRISLCFENDRVLVQSGWDENKSPDTNVAMVIKKPSLPRARAQNR